MSEREFDINGCDAEIDGILAKYIDGLLKGARPDPGALISAHPDLMPRLGNRLEALDFIEAVGLFTSEDAVGPPVERIDDFVLLTELGRGGMGIVFLAEQTALQRLVAVKMLKGPFLSSKQKGKRFQREAMIAGRLHHPNIVATITAGVSESGPYIVQEFVEGIACDRFIALHGRDASSSIFTDLSGEALMPILRSDIDRSEYWGFLCGRVADLARGLHYAHSLNIIHRDVKPSNLFLTHDGRMVITDFGLARLALDETITLSGETVGSPPYMSPEQARGDLKGVDHRSDIYSLGASLYELLSLGKPYSGDGPYSVIHKVVSEPPTPIEKQCPWLPGGLVEVVERSMARDRADRYGDALEMADDLERVSGGKRPSLVRVSTFRSRRKKFLLGRIALVVFAAVVVALLSLLYFRNGAVEFRLDLQEGAQSTIKTMDGVVMNAEDPLEPGLYQIEVSRENHITRTALMSIGEDDSLDHFIAHVDRYVLYSFIADRDLYSSPAIADFDGNGFPEIVDCSSNSQLYVFNLMVTRTGLESSTFDNALITESSPVPADIDRDSVPEILVAMSGGRGGCLRAFEVICTNGAISLRNSTTFEEFTLGGPTQSVPAVGDMDSDGEEDTIVICANDGVISALDFTGRLKWAYDVDGDPEIATQMKNSPIIVDVVGDETKEVVVASGGQSGDTECRLLFLSGLENVDPANRLVFEIKLPDWCRSYPDYIQSEDSDTTWFFVGTDSNINSVRIDRALNSEPLCLPIHDKCVWCRPAACDMDRDGLKEVLFCSDDSYIHLLHYMGEHDRYLPTQMYYFDDDGSLPNVAKEEVPLVGPAVGDLDGDGFDEIVFATPDRKESVLGILSPRFKKGDPLTMMVDGKELLPVMKDRELFIHLDHNVYAQPAIADLDNDGDLEVVVACLDNYVYVVDMCGSHTLWSSGSFPLSNRAGPVGYDVSNARGDTYSRIAFLSEKVGSGFRLSSWESALDVDGVPQSWLARKAWQVDIEIVPDRLWVCGDMNGDGSDDLVVTDESAEGGILISGDDGDRLETSLLANLSMHAGPSGAENTQLELDLDGDGESDHLVIDKRFGIEGVRGGESPDDGSLLWRWNAPQFCVPFVERGLRHYADIDVFQLVDWDGDGEKTEIMAAWKGTPLWVIKPNVRRHDDKEKAAYIWSLTQRPGK